ncbi:hypothetical protein PHMEG_00032092, partial [Phytophthora megakarya]
MKVLKLDRLNESTRPTTAQAKKAEREKKKAEREKQKAERLRWKDVIDNWLPIEGSDLLKLASDKSALNRMRTEGWETDRAKFPAGQDFPGLHNEEGRPTTAVLDCAESPVELFLYFLPREFWLGVERETNRYYDQELPARMDSKFRSQTGSNVMTLDQILANEKRMHSRIRAHEILQCIGLLLARMMCPHIRRLSDHWATTSIGAIPAGTFGRFMKRERFDRIMRNLHFSNNLSTDKAWKVRPIVDTLQRTFLSGYTTPPVLSFDEAMVPSRSRYNPMRQFMKDKPHRWGTKLFMTCCAKSAYCLRLEVYCGKSSQDPAGDEDPSDDSSGPAATLRNMNAVLPRKEKGVYHAVVTDRFYTSIQIALQLLKRNVYSVGTIQTRKRGFPTFLKQKESKRPKHVPRGCTQFAVSKSVPQLSTMVWFDNTIVYIPAATTYPRTKGDYTLSGCYEAYHQYMGGVDVHDQLRLQRYSVQLSLRFRKYYKSLALGLIDMAIINSFIIFRENCKMRGDPPADHA